ncbi:metal-dependent hydrolase family protein [Pseudomarimonas salicorniae]|uniref:Amidohydrolase family protein n=1 Tax=Pseudomarimonas salicorniae TaxID=2933270 RepID=A0ABT0GI93_9GAMM|nr:amidohydrolase family protein [Lysobacter sp. CAU 1642]MCK7593894.1 amidohydrolase family protein [Lysobacter sp. CAU 1642]
MRLTLIACLLALAPAPVLAEWQLVHAGNVLDRPGQPARGATTLVIANGKVHSLHEGHRAAGELEGVPADARVIDLRDQFVLPGLIDSHVHLDSDRAGVDAQLDEVSLSPAAKAFDAAVNARKTLMAGFTTVRNLGDRDGVTLALRDAVREGKVAGPRILDAGTSISATAGHMDGTLGYREELHAAIDRHANTCDGPDDCRRAVRRQVGRGVDVIKFASTGGVNSRIGAGIGQQIFEDEARAIVETAHLYGKKVAVHAHGGDGILLALKVGADSIEHGTLLDEAGLRAFLDSGAYYVPTLSTVNGYKERLAKNPEAYTGEVLAKIEWRIAITGKALRLAHSRGVRIAFGTDAGVSKHGRNADEFLLMVEHGMSPADALVAATVNAADLLGLGAEIGTLETGKTADLIAVDGNPLEDIATLQDVRWVIQGGKVVKSPQ